MPSPAAPTPLCGWEEAIERLRNSEPKIYQQLHEMLSLTSPLNQSVSSTSPLITDDVCDDSDDSDDSNLPDRIAQLIQSSMTRLQKKDHSQTKSRKALERILRAVRLFQEVGTAAASVDPIHVGIPWAGVNLVLGTVLSDTEQNAAALQGLAEIAPLITRYAKVELCYWTENQRKKDTADKFEQDFRALLVELYVKILVYEMSIVAHCRRGRLVRFARALPHVDDWQDLLQEIRSQDAACRRFIEVAQSADAIEFQSEIKRTLAEQDLLLNEASQDLQRVGAQSQASLDHWNENKNRAILDWISKAPPGADHAQTREKGKLNREYAGAGQWLFSSAEFVHWSTTTDISLPIFWLCGPVGTGKSSLVCLVIEKYLEGPHIPGSNAERIAYFYCTRKQGQQEESSPQAILQSLVRQLAWAMDDLSIAKIVKERYQRAQRLEGYGKSELSVEDCVDLLTQLIADHQHTIVIVDALDECADPDMLLLCLKRIHSSCADRLRLFVSSRMHIGVQHIFSEPIRTEIGRENRGDMDFYIRTEVEANKWRLEQCNAGDLASTLMGLLSSRAQGMFRWVELQLNLFFSPRTKLRRRDAVKKRLDRLEDECGVPALSAAYDEIFEMNIQEPEDEIAVARALKWIMGSYRPLTVREVLEAVSISSDGIMEEDITERYILDICSNFIMVDKAGFVQLAHLSVREYLTQNRGKEFSESAAHTQVAETCLSILLHHGCPAGTKLRFRKGGGLLGYATFLWHYHSAMTVASRGKQDSTLHSLLSQFLSMPPVSPAFRNWQSSLPAMHDISRQNLPYSRMLCQCAGETGPDPLLIACACGFSEIVRQQIAHGVLPLGQRPDNKHTPLSLACEYGCDDVVRLLLDQEAEVDERSMGGYTALHLAAQSEQEKVVLLLLNKGADVNLHIEGVINSGWTALHLAACHGAERIMARLLERNAQIDSRTSDGATALHVAASTGETAIVERLLQGGASIDIADNKGQTALSKAAITGHEDIVRLILQHCGEQRSVDCWIRQARFSKAVTGGDEPTVRSLLTQGVDLCAKNSRGEVALHWAVSRGHVGVARILLENGAQLEDVDKFGLTCLHLATLHRNTKMVQFLLDQGADMEARAGEGETVLHRATATANTKMIELLLRRGANPHNVALDTMEPGFGIEPEDFDAARDIIRRALTA